MRGDSEITLALGVNSHHEPRTTCRRHDWFQTSLPVIFTKNGFKYTHILLAVLRDSGAESRTGGVSVR